MNSGSELRVRETRGERMRRRRIRRRRERRRSRRRRTTFDKRWYRYRCCLQPSTSSASRLSRSRWWREGGGEGAGGDKRGLRRRRRRRMRWSDLRLFTQGDIGGEGRMEPGSGGEVGGGGGGGIGRGRGGGGRSGRMRGRRGGGEKRGRLCCSLLSLCKKRVTLLCYMLYVRLWRWKHAKQRFLGSGHTRGFLVNLMHYCHLLSIYKEVPLIVNI